MLRDSGGGWKGNVMGFGRIGTRLGVRTGKGMGPALEKGNGAVGVSQSWR